MSQLKPILNVNSNFELADPATPTVVTGFTETLSAGVTGSFLDRQDERGNPKRKVFTQLLKSRSDYIFNGRFSRRYSIVASGDIDLAMGATPTVPVAPGMVVAVGLVYRYNDTPVTFTLDILAGATPLHAVPAGGEAPNTPGEPFPYTWETAGVITLNDANQGPTELWTRIGFTVEIPPEVAFINPTLVLVGPASATVLDVGEFSVQALDSVIHAGG